MAPDLSSSLLKRIRWATVELWDDLHYPNRRLAARRFLCSIGLHWPITFGRVSGGDYTPPEDGWACDMCGHERLPYRAPLWSVPFVSRFVR